MARLISIPYGSIKTLLINNFYASDSPFQFLMVRLKQGVKPEYNIRTDISIPYGSIKTIACILSALVVWVFQFLMVRLKLGY